MTYNDWTNYETWNVALWIGNEQGSQEEAEGIARSESDDYHAGKALQEWIEEMNPLADDASMFSDLLGAALQEVNWTEIAEHYHADMTDDEDEREEENEDQQLPESITDDGMIAK